MTTKLTPLPGLDDEPEIGTDGSVFIYADDCFFKTYGGRDRHNQTIARIIDACRRSQVCEWTEASDHAGFRYWNTGCGATNFAGFARWCPGCGWPVEVKP